jgi:DNA-directed RNA polymerase specialized sigma24 family protein
VDNGFDAFAEAETPRLLGLAYALTGSPHDAWDLVQEALVRVGMRWRRLAELSPHQRAAVCLRVLEDLDHAAIAERLGCSVGTARSHLSRGLARIRERAPSGNRAREVENHE